MIKLGVNTVLFKAYSFREAAQAIKPVSYTHLDVYKRQAPYGVIGGYP